MSPYDPFAEHLGEFTSLEDIAALTGRSVDELRPDVLRGWSHSRNYYLRSKAALEGGRDEWRALLHDDSAVVRMSVAMVADEVTCLGLVEDEEPAVRTYLAQYQTDPIRLALVQANETDQFVMQKIMQYGNPEVKRAMIEAVYDRPKDLRAIVKFAVASDIKRLTHHPDQSVRVQAAQYATREDCERVMQEPGIGFQRYLLEAHLEDMDRLGQLMNRGRTKETPIHRDLLEEDEPEL